MQIRFGGAHIDEDYDHIDAVYVTAISQSGVFKQADYDEAIKIALSQMSSHASTIGANALINVTVRPELALFDRGVNQAIIIGTGDAVKFK